MPRTLAQIYVHIVFATKHRHPYISPSLRDNLYPLLRSMIQKQGGTPIAIGGMPDHMHLLIRARPQLVLADLVKTIKGTSSRWINSLPETEDVFGWQEGYAIFSVSPSMVDRVRRYIDNQEHHHRNTSTATELERLSRTYLPTATNARE